MKILIFGHVCIDQNTSEKTSYVSAGSSAIFINKVYAQFPDCQVTIVSSYGPDFQKYLEGITIYPKTPNRNKTLVYENDSRGDKRIQRAHNRNQSVPILIDAEVTKLIKEAELIFFAPILPNLELEYLKQAHSLKTKEATIVLLPQGYCRAFDTDDTVLTKDFSEADSVLPLVDLVIVSEHDSPNMLVKAKTWAEKYEMISVVTKGEKGAVVFTNDHTFDLSTKPLEASEIIDSVGSGDIFSAGFAYKYRQTKDLKEAGRFANELARQCLFYPSDKIKIDFKSLA